jgi:Domain of Unknown Function (DUF1206)
MSAVAPRPLVSRVVRLGYLAKGLIYCLIGVLAMRVGLGLRGGRITDPSGVLSSLLRQPFGLVMLTCIGVGILGYCAYYVYEAIADTRRRGGGVRGWTSRILTVIKAAGYGTIGVQAIRIVFFNDRPRDGTEKGASLLLQVPLGNWLLAAIGIGVAIYGVTQLQMVWRGGADDDIDVARVRREAAWLLPLGRFGTAARSLIILVMGLTLAWSGFYQRAAFADGYREVLATIASFNPWAVAAIGTGLLSFGVYQLGHARYARLSVS